MRRYLKVECPICGNISQGSGPGNVKQGCDHFERVDELENIVIFANDFGEEVPVDLSAVGDRCISFNCPICREKLDACTRGDAREYKIEGKCSHFRELVTGKEDMLIARFTDKEGHIKELPIS